MPAKKKNQKKNPQATSVPAGQDADLAEHLNSIGNLPIAAYRHRRGRLARVGSMSASDVKAAGGAFKAGVELAAIQEKQGDFAAGDILYVVPAIEEADVKHRPTLGVFIFPSD